MKICFLIFRNTYFRIVSPIIDTALKSGHEVFCFHDYSQPKTGSKGYQFPALEQVPSFSSGKPVCLSFESSQDFIEKAVSNGIVAVVSVDFWDSYLDLRKQLKEKGIFWFSLQNGFDTAVNSGKFLSGPDKFFFYSLEWFDWMADFLKTPNLQKELGDKAEVVGFWLAEQKKIIDPVGVRTKWGIPFDKKIVLLLPFPFGSSKKSFWTHCVFGTRFLSRENDFEAVKSIRKFCDKNNAFFLVKCRQKDPAKKYLTRIADKVLYDEGFYPSTIMECFSIANICFNFYSTCAIESAALGVPNVCIAPDVKKWQDINNAFWESILRKEKDFFDTPGVSYLQTVSEIIKNLPQKSFSDFSFSAEKQAQYLQKYAMGETQNASPKIIKEIEKIIQVR